MEIDSWDHTQSEKIMKNIKIFDTQVAIIFAKLYDNFPKKINIDCSTLEMHSKDITIEEHSEYCDATVTFLVENGFISVGKTMIGGGYVDVILTIKGLNALKKIPKSISNKPTAGEIISDEVRKGFISSSIGIISNTVFS